MNNHNSDRRRSSGGFRRASILGGPMSEDDEKRMAEIRRLSLGVGFDYDSLGYNSSVESISSSEASTPDLQNLDPMLYDPKGARYPIKMRNEFHKIIFDFTESRVFSTFILGIILLNTIILIASTWIYVDVRWNWYFAALDNCFLGIYVMEVLLKLYAWRREFFNVGWNIMDFLIVVFNLADFCLPLIVANVRGFNGATIFRLLRIFRAVRAIRALRVLRTIRFLANLQVIMTTLLQSIRSIGAIVMLISLVMYMFAVIGRGLYAEADPIRFGNMFNALFTLFQLLTLDDWFEIYSDVERQGSWHIFLYLTLYIVMEYFIFLNLFVAVLVDNFQLTLEAQNEANRQKMKRTDDSDDEEEFKAHFEEEVSDAESDYSDEDRSRIKKAMNEHYAGMNEKDVKALRHYFSLLASLEYNHKMHTSQQRVLHMMVDMCVENPDDL